MKILFTLMLFYFTSCEKHTQHNATAQTANANPGWIRLMANPKEYDGQSICLRGVIATRSGAGTGVELWVADWAKVQGQMEFFVHLEEESTGAFFGGNNTDKAHQLEGQLVEILGVFVSKSKESMTGEVPGIGQIKSIMICHPATVGARAGEILLRPVKK
ncbi:hypothetical protein [Prosthecobacter sp.]